MNALSGKTVFVALLVLGLFGVSLLLPGDVAGEPKAPHRPQKAEAADQRVGTPPERELARLRLELTALRSLVNELHANADLQKKSRERFQDELLRLAISDPLVGTIMAFGGDWPPKTLEGKPWPEKELGWYLCDGRQLSPKEDAELFASIAYSHGRTPHANSQQGARQETPAEMDSFHLPDLQGVFLRGVGHLDPQASERVSLHGGNTGGAVGSFQDWATARPRGDFFTDEKGDHTHPLSTRFNQGTDPNKDGAEITTHQLSWTQNGAGMQSSGKHVHSITGGGDTETRPKNIAVHYIIKFKSS